MNFKIRHDSENSRFETRRDGCTAEVEYRLKDGELDIIHTYVPKSIEGQGIAAALVKAAYDYALANDLKPCATCAYAVVWLKRHPSYIGQA
jgi:predicted GNAT family acetyltransferase